MCYVFCGRSCMKTWSKADLLGLFLVISGIIGLIFCASTFLPTICFLISSLTLLHCLYKARYDGIKYRNMLCRYHSILQVPKDGWIAWNEVGEYIASCKKFQTMFNIKNTQGVLIADITESIEKKDGDELAFQFNQLKKTGAAFCTCVKLLESGSKIEIRGSRASINNQATIALWCSDITHVSSIISKLESNLFTSEEAIDSLKGILDEIPMPIWRREENLRISYCNKAYMEALSTSREKIIKNNLSLISGALFGQGHSLAENARKCGKDQVIAQSCVIKGCRKKLEVHEHHASQGSLVGYAVDMTAEDNLSNDLDKVIASNYEVLENLSTAIAIFGVNTRLMFFNSSYQKLMKLDVNWLHSNPTYAEVLDECRNNRQLPEHADFQAFKKSQMAMFMFITSPTQELMHLPNGKTLRMLVAPYPLGGLLFVFEDVTDSLVLQRKNNTLLAVHKETIDHLHEGVVVYGSDNRLKIVNNTMMQIWNTDLNDASEMKGIHLSETLEYMKDRLDYGDDWEEYRVNMISSLTDRTTKTGRLNLRDDTIILFSYIPLPDGAHMLTYIDITDTCVVEKAIRDKEQAIQEAHKLRYEFISAISVELKEPINSLMGFSGLLSKEYYGPLNDKQKEYCKYISSASHQLYQLINNLLEMFLMDIDSGSLDLSEFYVEDAINEVISTVEMRSQEKGIAIIRHLEKEKVQFTGDRKRIKQCLFNILINVVHINQSNRQITVRTVSDQESLRIVIRDDGKIDSSTSFKGPAGTCIHKISEYNAASMSIVKSLIEMHGGTLKTDVDSNGFSYVMCTLPMPQAQSNSDTSDNENTIEEGCASQETPATYEIYDCIMSAEALEEESGVFAEATFDAETNKKIHDILKPHEENEASEKIMKVANG